MAGATASNTWDEVWAEFDARQPARPARPVVARRSEGRERTRPTAGLRRLLGLICAALAGLYLLSPLAAALQLGAAIQRGDTEALARQIDRDALRQALASSLASRLRDRETPPMPDFITGMAQDLAARLAEPEALANLLSRRLTYSGPARELLGRVRIIEAGLWEIALAPPRFPRRTILVTLAMVDPLRLRWEIRSIELPLSPEG